MVEHTGHLKLKLRKRGTKRNLVVLIALGVWFGAFVALAVWFGVQNTQYRQRLADYTAGVSQALHGANDRFKKLHDASDTAGTAKALGALAQTLSAKEQQTPAAPSLLGLQFGIDAERTQQTKTANAVKKYAATLQQAAAYIEYQQKVSALLQEILLKDAQNLEQLKQLATAWQNAVTALKQVTPPTEVLTAHQTLQQRIEAAQLLVAQLPPLYEKTDTTSFTAKQKELTAAIEAIRPVATDFAAAAAAHDGALARDLAVLKSNL